MLQESRTIAGFEGHLNRLSYMSHFSESVEEATREILASKYNENKKGEEPILRALQDMEQRLLAIVRGDRDD